MASGSTRSFPDDVLVLQPAVELDFFAVDGLRADLENLARRHPRRIVIDLDAVTFVDCSVLSLLVDEERKLADAGVELRLANPPRVMRRLLRLTRLDETLAVSERLSS